MPSILIGLVLAGGRSRRMGQDKSVITYHERPQVEVCFDLLRTLLPEVYISNRADQRDLPGHAGKPQLHDRYPEAGPLGGLRTAFDTHPDRAWLVVACDLPFLDRTTLRYLLDHRDPTQSATAFRSVHDGLPEPLCAIYEPALGKQLADFQRQGLHSPRTILRHTGALLLDLPTPSALENVNSPAECAVAQRKLQDDPRGHHTATPDR